MLASLSSTSSNPLGQPSNRRCTRITVLADHGLPVGVMTLRSFSALAIALADWPVSSSSTGRSHSGGLNEK